MDTDMTGRDRKEEEKRGGRTGRRRVAEENEGRNGGMTGWLAYGKKD